MPNVAVSIYFVSHHLLNFLSLMKAFFLIVLFFKSILLFIWMWNANPQFYNQVELSKDHNSLYFPLNHYRYPKIKQPLIIKAKSPYRILWIWARFVASTLMKIQFLSWECHTTLVTFSSTSHIDWLIIIWLLRYHFWWFALLSLSLWHASRS